MVQDSRLLILCLRAMSGLALLFRQCVLTQTALCDVTEGADISPSDTSNTRAVSMGATLLPRCPCVLPECAEGLAGGG